MKIIPTSVPVFIENLEKQENCTYSVAKLKVFYIGETPDHRVFTKEFAEQAIMSLHSCPIVGYYSEEDNDFKGHNHIQYVYGHVPETAQFEWVTDEQGNTWLVTPVILYTERDDNIGEVARKIVGKQHSLELNPKTLKYRINRDFNGEFKNIEMLYGEFVGLSVLGDNERPAFTNSAFFTNNETFTQFANGCRSSFDRFLNFLNDSDGGNITIMDFSECKENVAKILQQQVLQESKGRIYNWMANNGIDGWLIENDDSSAIIQKFSSDNYEIVKYEINQKDGNFVLENPVNVIMQFVDKEENDDNDFAMNVEEKEKENKNEEPKEKENEDSDITTEVNEKPNDKEETVNTEETVDTEEDTEEDTENTEDTEAEIDEKEKEKICKEKKLKCKEKCVNNTESEGVSNAAQNDAILQEEEKDTEQMGASAASTCSSALSDSERLELERFRRQDKINLINEYTGDIGQEELDNFIKNVDNYSKEELTIELNKIFREIQKQNKKTEFTNSINSVTVFKTITTGTDYNECDPADVINKYKK